MSDVSPRLTAALADRYRIEREIGAGCCSRLAHHVDTGRLAATVLSTTIHFRRPAAYAAGASREPALPRSERTAISLCPVAGHKHWLTAACNAGPR